MTNLQDAREKFLRNTELMQKENEKCLEPSLIYHKKTNWWVGTTFKLTLGSVDIIFP